MLNFRLACTKTHFSYYSWIKVFSWHKPHISWMFVFACFIFLVYIWFQPLAHFPSIFLHFSCITNTCKWVKKKLYLISSLWNYAFDNPISPWMISLVRNLESKSSQAKLTTWLSHIRFFLFSILLLWIAFNKYLPMICGLCV